MLALLGSNPVCISPELTDVILELVDLIMSHGALPEDGYVWILETQRRLIPPPAFELLVQLSFPPRVKVFEKVYPSLKKVALAGAAGSMAITQQIFTFSCELAEQEGNPVLAEEATAIAILCCKNWDNLYEENLEASVPLLKKLVDEWKDHSYTLTLNQTIKSFRLKNEKAITEGGANVSLYKEADKSCRFILWKLHTAP